MPKGFPGFKGFFSQKCIYDILTIILIFVAIYVVARVVPAHFGYEGFDGGQELVLIHMDGCGHCTKFMPEWEAASAANTTNIGMRAVERSEADGPELTKKFDVNGFPTVLLIGSGEKKDTYKGERTKDGLLQYLSSL